MGKITKVKRKGRRVSWKGSGKKGKLKVSGSKTKVTIAGKKAKRKSLKKGMACTFKVRGASQALNIDCKCTPVGFSRTASRVAGYCHP